MANDTTELRPKDHAEAVALFRAQVIAPLVCRELKSRGELSAGLRELAKQHWLPPDALASRKLSAPTLERWYYAYRSGGLDALRPRPRKDRGAAQGVDDKTRHLLLAIRREHPHATVSLILRTLHDDGRLARGTVSASTVRRLYIEHGLDRATLLRAGHGARLRWQAARPDELWHADVCHGPALRDGDKKLPLRIHAILDDHSRYVVALQACSTERESEMLALAVRAFRKHGTPSTLYLDNGPTYSGEALSLACHRLGIALVHAKPYDPEARGKMERFWRTMREQCLDHLGEMRSLQDVQVRLLAWLDRHYHVAPHAGLMGKTPAEIYELPRERQPDDVTEAQLRDALTIRQKRRTRRDGTVSVGGIDWELDAGFLAGRVVTVGRTLADATAAPWVEHDGRVIALHRVDPVHNARRARRPDPTHRVRRGIDAVAFDPAGATLDALLRRPS